MRLPLTAAEAGDGKLDAAPCTRAEYGVDILEGAACRQTYEEIAQALALTKESAEARRRQMKKVWRRRMVKLGTWSGMDLLRVVSSTPGVVAALREAA